MTSASWPYVAIPVAGGVFLLLVVFLLVCWSKRRTVRERQILELRGDYDSWSTRAYDRQTGFRSTMEPSGTTWHGPGLVVANDLDKDDPTFIVTNFHL